MRQTTALLIGAAVIALASGRAHAQAAKDAPEPANAQDDTIVVVGQPLANRVAVAEKRSKDVVADVLATDDLGKLPDANLAEAIGRVPGASTFEDEGTGLYVQLRGLNKEFVALTIDGLSFSSPARTFESSLRGANLEAIPSSFVARVDVLKSVTPDMDGDAIAGTVNLVTRSAFDQDRMVLRGSIAGAQYYTDVPDHDRRLSGRGTLSFSSQFGANHEFGIVLDANLSDIRRDNYKPGAWFGRNDIGGGQFVPTEIGGFFYEREEQSSGVIGKLEYRPAGGAVQAWITGSYADSDIGISKNKQALYSGKASNFTPSTSTFKKVQGTYRHDDIHYGVDDAVAVMGGVDVQLGAKDRVRVRGSLSSALSYQDDLRSDFTSGNLSGSYAYDGQSFLYTLDAASAPLFVDPSYYTLTNYADYHETGRQKVRTLQGSWVHGERNDPGFGVEAGGQWKDFTYAYRASNTRLRSYVGSAPFTSYLNVVDWQFPGTNNPQTLMLGSVDPIRALVEGGEAAKFGKTSGSYGNGTDFDVSEQVFAGYALAKYRGADFLLIGGVRYEHTDFWNRTHLAGIDDAALVRRDGSYGDWLPSAALRWDATSRLVLRAGFSQTLGRPDPRDLARQETLPNDNSGVYSRGNPDLKPRRSTNYDASAEFYFARDSLISVAAFHKDIDDEIYTLNTAYTFVDGTGASIPSYYIEPANAGKARISGVEVGFIANRLRFLPGPLSHLGVLANATFNEGTIELVDANGAVVRRADPAGMSKFLLRSALFYDDGRVSGQIAYQRTSRQYQELSTDGSADLTLYGYGRLDVSLAYRVLPQVQLFGQVRNVTDAEQRFDQTNYFERLAYGRTLWFGLNVKM